MRTSIASCAILIVLLSTALLNVSFATNPRHPSAPLIVGGRIARKKYRKYLAYLFVRTKSGYLYTCTGTTIGRRWLLTAAHCVDDFGSSNDVEVPSSYAHISVRSLNGNLGKKYYFKSVHVYKDYNAGTNDFRHDIAVVELSQNIIKKRYRRVRLGGAPKPKTEVIGAGYGALNENGQNPNYAMQTIVVSQSFSTCASRESNSIKQYLRNSLHVCATSVGFPDEGETDTCYGDSGGPLFKHVKGKPVQYAITSFSTTGCAEPGGTPWYVRVSHYKSEVYDLMRSGSHSNWKAFI